MTNAEISKWLANLKNDIGQSQYQPLWHYAEALDKAIEALETLEAQRWIPCNDCEKRCDKWENSKISQE